MVSIKFLGGVNQIGGNKFLIEDKTNDTNIFLDFGMNFTERAKYFEEFVRPRTANGIIDFLETGLLPNIKGIYRHDLLEFAGMEKHPKPMIDGIVLSHAHLDHSAYVSFIDEKVPIFTSEITKVILKAVQETSQRNIEDEIINFKERPIIDRGRKPIERKFPKVNKKFKINGLEIELIPVDHSIPGACGIVVYTSDKIIAYTGDLRMHGTQGYLTREFIERLKIIKPDIFLCEGTRIDENEKTNEAYVKVNCANTVLSKAKGLVIADFAWKDTTRFKTFFEVAKETNRKLAIPFKDAYYIRAMREIIPDLPKIDDENILLYQDKKGTGTYLENDYQSWEKEFLNMKNTVKADYISKHQDEIIIAIGYYDLPELIDLKPRIGSIYIKSTSEVMGEEEEFDLKRLHNWLDHFGIQYYHFHASGHAPGVDIVEMINEVNPKILIPVHTDKAEMFNRIIRKVNIVKPEVGKEIEIK
jgi:ribonuclease J